MTDAPLALRTPQLTNQTSSGLVVYSDIEGGHLPPRATGIKAGGRVVLSFVACERRSVDWGAASWSCRPDDAEPTAEERAVLERCNACFRIERREASHAIVASFEGDRPHAPAATKETQLVFLRRTQVNRTKENIALGCESAGGHPCDPVGSKKTGRTLEQVTRSRASNAPRAMRLSLLWDRAILSFKVGDGAAAARDLAATEQELAAESSNDLVARQVTSGAPALHALLDGTLSLTDPCRQGASASSPPDENVSCKSSGARHSIVHRGFRDSRWRLRWPR